MSSVSVFKREKYILNHMRGVVHTLDIKWDMFAALLILVFNLMSEIGHSNPDQLVRFVDL